MTHPIRQAEIHTFQRFGDPSLGVKWIARFYPYDAYPVFFSGETRAEVTQKAEAMRADAIEKHEAACIAREEGRRKAAETRARKAKA